MPLIIAALLLAGAEVLPLLAAPKHAAPVDEVRFFGAIAAELRSGSSIRSALANAAAGREDQILITARRMAAAGGPLDQVAAVLVDLPVNGSRAAAALRVVAMSGGRSADVFSRLADRAAEEADLRRERRALTTSTRLSALVIGGLPIVALLAGGWGRVGDLIASGSGGAVLAAIGLTAQAGGSLLVWRMATQ
jgi:Flp pilus assembly protein TadB